MPANTTPAKLGRFQTRLSRVVDIVASRVVQDPVAGHPGKTVDRRLWTGRLYRSDMKTVDSIFDWENSGAFSNQRGVASPNDLSIFMRELTPDELAAGVKAIPESLRGDRQTASMRMAQDRASSKQEQPSAADDFRKRAAELQRK